MSPVDTQQDDEVIEITDDPGDIEVSEIFSSIYTVHKITSISRTRLKLSRDSLSVYERSRRVVRREVRLRDIGIIFEAAERRDSSRIDERNDKIPRVRPSGGDLELHRFSGKN